ncbi:hypothetical protein ABPG75_009447 [Micractinium tetrahymenae]
MEGGSALELAPAGELKGCWRNSLGIDFSAALAAAAATHLAGAAWLHFWDRRRCLPPGGSRLAVVAPVVALNLVTPLLFCRSEDAIARLIATFNLTWLASFKAVSWALNRGPLCMLDLTPVQLLAVYATPLTPAASDNQAAPPRLPPTKAATSAAAATTSGHGNGGLGTSSGGNDSGTMQQQSGSSEPPPGRRAAEAYRARRMPRVGSQGRLNEDAGSGAGMLLTWIGKLALIAAMVWVMQQPLPGLLQSFAYGLALYGLLSAIMDGPAAGVIGLTGLRVSPHFDRPWRSTSVAAFWSKRWDLAAGNTLRQLVYDPVCEGRWVALPPGAAAPPPPSAARMALGTAASFAVSGAVHEAIFWYLTGRTTGGVWLCFFLAQVPLIFGERVVLAALRRRGIRLPGWLRNIATALLLVATGQLLFWPPAIEHGVVSALVGNTQTGILQLAAAVRGVLLR